MAALQLCSVNSHPSSAVTAEKSVKGSIEQHFVGLILSTRSCLLPLQITKTAFQSQYRIAALISLNPGLGQTARHAIQIKQIIVCLIYRRCFQPVWPPSVPTDLIV